jgi:hypothetical protein
VLITHAPNGDVTTPDRLTIEIIGAQHGGSEPAGAESLLFIARDLLAGDLRHLLEDCDVILIPNANPDGLENVKRANANGVNLNIDMVSLTQPESQALVAALHRYKPEVVLDVHESAVLKKKSLALEGYMTNFSTQFEIANNPSIVPALRRFAMNEVLLPWIAAGNDAGLIAHRYIGEIKSSRQPVTNGGLTLNNFRNRAGIEGVLSFLMETRLDPKDGTYPTFQNIKERVRLQRISIREFLNLLHAKRDQALATITAARKQAATAPLVLDARYGPALGNARVPIGLRRIADGQLEKIEFVDHRSVHSGEPLPMPAAYVVRAEETRLRALLDRHGVAYDVLAKERADWVVEFLPGPATTRADAILDNVRERTVRARANPGDLWVDLDQPRARLAVLLLEPRSTSSVWRKPEFVSATGEGTPLPIFRVAH